MPIDLSKVLFICSANQLDTMPAPLLDRLEKIELSGYTDFEKVQIAQKYLIPKALNHSGLTPYCHQSPLTVEAIQYLASYYSRESGVRSLARLIQ